MKYFYLIIIGLISLTFCGCRSMLPAEDIKIFEVCKEEIAVLKNCIAVRLNQTTVNVGVVGALTEAAVSEVYSLNYVADAGPTAKSAVGNVH